MKKSSSTRKKSITKKTIVTVRTKQLELDLADKPLLVTIEWRKGIINASLRLLPEGLTLRVPDSMTEKNVQTLLKERSSWIEGNWRRLLDNEKRYKENKGLLYYHGKAYQLTLIIEDSNKIVEKIGIDEERSRLYLRVPSGEKSQWRDSLLDSLRQKGKETILERLQTINQHLGFKYNKVTIKDQKTRWGSCSSKKNLNFSWRLVLMPPEVLDYVIIHELCHLEELNHSPKFWRRVGQLMPQYETYRQWLRKNGQFVARTVDEVEIE
ncbi:M48 family metallopeptidase [Heliorestis acidaminivorans]|uniref:M48 family metallopeptidase n=1 Tax=Heliorestis acidaminivorans TaxID=553427 RepID=A0A6I0EZ68_9FIRM|nr:SprT family zinc-dependent metalloprotease [Heliorestis acidaminivorans]KAB2952692.1 M48 family metallopeptidase [Heliorestis acidaminivorans]